MKRCLNIACALGVVGLLAACSTWGPFTDQPSAGIVKASIEVCADETVSTPYPCEASVVDGKDKQNVKLKITSPNGWTMDYTADKSTASDALAIRAEVDKAISGDVKEASPGIVDTVTNAIVRTLGSSP